MLIDPSEITLRHVIGEGSFGRVWSATWQSSDVAVKEFTLAQARVSASVEKVRLSLSLGGDRSRLNTIESVSLHCHTLCEFVGTLHSPHLGLCQGHRETGFQAAFAGGAMHRRDIIEEIVGEAGIMAYLRHPKILQLYGCSLTAQAIWIVSELCSHGSLRQVLDDTLIPLSAEQRLRMVPHRRRSSCDTDSLIFPKLEF